MPICDRACAAQIALGRVVISSREPTLRTHDEVAEVFDRILEVKVNTAMLTIARQIVEQHAWPFDPAEFVDHYSQALRALINEKRQAQPLTRASTVSPGS